ncbi:ABC transporter substrate-binding protein [Chelatococcus reniformis]|uniref:ABC transporter substrate-binding protein n=1 Tax=Chelatococcus reniformis TaxID=1494448 RepID=A0A916XFN4_9HYPH|nr:ABC transporter substrate-binding protein [Chelatococcus reniformis]GGC70026.1 ABC transporter substrate-binding protein [Chelatococcus reniformis]
MTGMKFSQTCDRDRRVGGYGLHVAAAIVALAAASGAAQAQECQVKLGAMGPMSGGAAAWGLALRQGVEFVAAQANADGGVQVGDRKCRVSVMSYDSKYSAEGAASAANSMASDNIKLIIGPVGSPEATGAKPVAQRNGQITFNSSYAKDAIGPETPLAFHQLAGPAQWAPKIVAAAKQKFGIKSVVVVAPNDQGGTDVASVNAKAYEADGIRTKQEYYQRGTTNFAPLVTRIMNENPDAVDTASSPPADGATMVKQLLEAGYGGVFGRLGGPGTLEIIKAAGGVKELKNFYWLELVPTEDEKIVALQKDFKTVMKADAPNNTLLYTAAAAARMVLKAVTAAGTADDAPAVAKALHNLEPVDPYLGKGTWKGKAAFGIQQELVFPVGLGLIVDGKSLGVTAVDLADSK